MESRRIALFDPVHGIGLTVAAGSGRSWMEEPGGDPRHAHLCLDVPSDTLDPAPDGRRLRSGTVFVGWDALLRFADALAELATRPSGEAALSGTGPHAALTVERRADGAVRAAAAFTVGHRIELELRCRTRWTSADLADRADQIRAAVHAARPAPA